MSLTVYKLKADGQVQLHYSAEKRPIPIKNGVCVRATFTHPDVDTGYVVFAQGDTLHEYFYSDRYYNIFALYAGSSDQLKGWYCNICRPAVFEDGAIRCEDLALDVWVTPSGDVLVLDEDEFAALGLDSAETEKALAAVAQLKALAGADALPR